METSNHPCPKCNEKTFFMNEDLSGLISLKKDEDGKLKSNKSSVFPVRAFFCKSCGYVELKYEPN